MTKFIKLREEDFCIRDVYTRNIGSMIRDQRLIEKIKYSDLSDDFTVQVVDDIEIGKCKYLTEYVRLALACGLKLIVSFDVEKEDE